MDCSLLSLSLWRENCLNYFGFLAKGWAETCKIRQLFVDRWEGPKITWITRNHAGQIYRRIQQRYPTRFGIVTERLLERKLKTVWWSITIDWHIVKQRKEQSSEPLHKEGCICFLSVIPQWKLVFSVMRLSIRVFFEALLKLHDDFPWFLVGTS